MKKLIGLAALALLLIPASAQAQPSCGDTITQDTTLTADLTDCSGFAALTVMGDVTLDLNGHAITGNAQVGVNAGHGRITLKDGSVSGFLIGVEIARGGDAYVTGITASHNGYGFNMGHSQAVFERDRADFNTFDGFHARTEPGDLVLATFIRDRADSNGELGINTSRATDGGKNHAHKNGDPRQCVGVVCKP
jgi:hypothetical protein